MGIDVLLLQTDYFYPNTDNLESLKTITIRRILPETRVTGKEGKRLPQSY